jgi:hypothetical protein
MLRGRERKTFRSFEDLTSCWDEIHELNSDATRTIERIYADGQLATAAQFASEVCPPIPDIDFETCSWSEIRDSLQAVIDSRTSALANLVRGTATYTTQ